MTSDAPPPMAESRLRRGLRYGGVVAIVIALLFFWWLLAPGGALHPTH